MVFLNCFLIGILSAALATFAAGGVASLCVKWHRISPREGGSGYFIVFIGFMGLIVGLFIGCVCGGVVEPDSFPTFFEAVGIAFGIILSLAGIGAMISRCLADIPPTMDGEELFLIAEFRMPAVQTESPANEPGNAYIQLSSLPRGKHTTRKSQQGPLWIEDARLEEGRWIIRGAADIFTRRGRRLLTTTLGSKYNQGFVVPLPGNPRKKHTQWSGWLPHWPKGLKLVPEQMEYRFRVQRTSEPMKTETIGPFEIDTVTSAFRQESTDNQPTIVSWDTFHVRYKAQPVAVQEPIRTVANLPGTATSLLINGIKSEWRRAFYLLREADGKLQVDLVADDNGNNALTQILPPPSVEKVKRPWRYRLTNRFELAPGLYRVGDNGVLDTRTFTIHVYSEPTDSYGGDRVLVLSPDARSFVRYVMVSSATGETTNGLSVIDFVGDRSYLLKIDRSRMHYTKTSWITGEWVAHHFEWVRDSNGIDQLIERPDFKPLPFCGEFTAESDGRHRYWLDCVGEDMRKVIEQYLIDKYNAQRLPPDAADYEHGFTIEGRKLAVACADSSNYVSITMSAETDAAQAEKIAKGFDAELAEGKYDSLFRPK